MNSTTPPTEKGTPGTSPADAHGGVYIAPKRFYQSVSFWAVLAIALGVLIYLTAEHGAQSTFFTVVTFLEVILLFNVLIIVHELGHFLAAKWCGLKIDKFAIWFGKPLWSQRIDGVDYILGSIPAGGYVALPQMAPMEAIEGKNETPREELPPASPWQKIIVAIAGPIFSFGLALFFATIVWVVGKPVIDSDATTKIGYVVPDQPAEKAGLRAGDKIISIDGHTISHFMGMGDSVIWRIITSTADTIPVVVERDGAQQNIEVSPQKDPTHEHHWYDRSATRKIGIAPEDSLVIKKLTPDSPALVAGLQPGDRLLQMNGQPVFSPLALYYQLKNHPLDAITFQVSTAGTVHDVKVQPEKPISPATLPADGPQSDIGIADWDNGKVNLIYPNPWHQVRESVLAVTGTLQALFAPHSNIGASQLSGPVGIMNILFAVLSSENGWRLALWFAVLINVNLALLNMFPLPVLDGGHIALSLIEWVRRRPLSMRILEPVQTACALALIGYMAFITFYDLQDSGRMAFSNGGEIKFAPKTTGGQ